jgi:multiple sugar transport system permease protein
VLGFQWIPSSISFQAYVDMWHTIQLMRYLINSTFVSLVATVIAMVFGLCAAYAICRHRFFGRRTVVYAALVTQTFPGVLFLLPLFVLFASLQRALGISLVGGYTGLILTYLSFSLPFCIWLLAGYMSSVPLDAEEAAMTDGCGQISAFLRITLRMAAPGVLAVGVLTFIGCWSEVMFASVLTNEQTRTLPIGFELFKNSHGVVQWNQLMAAALTISVPVVVAFLWLQRFFVQGISAGSVK